MKIRVIGAAALGVILSVVLAQGAEALCSVQPLTRLVKTSDDVWWGTVTEATGAPLNGGGIWKLTVHLDDVLKGTGHPGDTVTVYTYSCGVPMSQAQADTSAQSFVGDQRLFLVSLDGQNRAFAYSDVVGMVSNNTPSTPANQYNAALAIVGQAGQGQSFAGTKMSPEPSALAIVTPFVLALAVAIVIAATIFIVRRRGSM